MWCPVDIRDHEQGSCDQASVCVHRSTSESSECDFVLLELLTLVASRNTTLFITYFLIGEFFMKKKWMVHRDDSG